MNPELKHLRYFVAVAEELNFSAAARRLYVSQQALSRVIQQFERELGVRLFDRTTRTVRLTRAGDALFESAKRSIQTAEHAFDTARQAAQGDQGRPLRVDISSSGLETGALIVRRLRREHPQIRVHQVEDVGMAADHKFAEFDAVPVSMLADVELLLPSEAAAAEWVEFVGNFCGQAGVRPRRWPGSTHGMAAHAEVLRESGCVVPTVAWIAPPGDLVFRPLVEPAPVLPWSMMTGGTDNRPELEALRKCVWAVGEEEGWPAPTKESGESGGVSWGR